MRGAGCVGSVGTGRGLEYVLDSGVCGHHGWRVENKLGSGESERDEAGASS